MLHPNWSSSIDDEERNEQASRRGVRLFGGVRSRHPVVGHWLTHLHPDAETVGESWLAGQEEDQ
jgi:hypothetical protein